MSRDRKVITAQVVASTLALLVVYLTLLTPDNEGPLFGVQTPGGDEEPAVTRQHAKATDNPGGSGGSPQRPRAPVGPAFTQAAPTSPAPQAIGPETEQYANSLSRLQARLTAG